MHIIELNNKPIYRSRNYQKIEKVFLKLAAEHKPVVLITIKRKGA